MDSSGTSDKASQRRLRDRIRYNSMDPEKKKELLERRRLAYATRVCHQRELELRLPNESGAPGTLESVPDRGLVNAKRRMAYANMCDADKERVLRCKRVAYAQKGMQGGCSAGSASAIVGVEFGGSSFCRSRLSSIDVSTALNRERCVDIDGIAASLTHDLLDTSSDGLLEGLSDSVRSRFPDGSVYEVMTSEGNVLGRKRPLVDVNESELEGEHDICSKRRSYDQKMISDQRFGADGCFGASSSTAQGLYVGSSSSGNASLGINEERSCRFNDAAVTLMSDLLMPSASARQSGSADTNFGNQTSQGVSYALRRFTLLQQLIQEEWELPPTGRCVYCKAVRFHREPPGFCCNSGQVYVPVVVTHPILYYLFKNHKSKYFRPFKRQSRRYNNCFAFTSIRMKVDERITISRGQGVYSLRVVGNIYHFLKTLVFDETKYKLQLYFYESESDIDNVRLTQDDWNCEIIEALRQNPYAKLFGVLRRHPDVQSCKLAIKCNPMSDVVGAIIEDDVDLHSNVDPTADMVVDCDGVHSYSINYYYGCFDGLQYPLLFACGESSWHTGIEKNDPADSALGRRTIRKGTIAQFVDPFLFTSADSLIEREAEVFSRNKRKRSNVSCREFYCYRCQIREDDLSCLLHSGQLGHQYIIDMYIKIETQRLDYFRLEQQQRDARIESLQGIVDSLAVNGENDPNKIGRRMIMPSSFIGGPRDMRKRYLNAMSIVQKFGKPDLFITMTCNPNWVEIKKYLHAGEQAQDRPDLVARVFRAKLEELKEQIVKKKIFGEVVAYAYVVEYQKRGLPHAHWLVILKDGYKLTSVDMYDGIISAEIPDPDTHPFLHKYVLQHMMHGPCGFLNPKCACMQNGRCKYKYPKSFCEETSYGENAYPQYRRRDDGRWATVRGAKLDNRSVIPYNPYLLTLLNCHINVEIACDIKLVKYLYKYIYKGYDEVSFQVIDGSSNENCDEIKNFQRGRWIAAPEAYWRVFGYAMSDMSSSVEILPVHLENQQSVVFGRKRPVEEIVGNPYILKTKLTEFFWMNTHDQQAIRLNLLYSEFPEYFVWHSNGKYWKIRQRCLVVGRLVAANPIEGERYYLRLLLSNIRCPTSYTSLLTVEAVKYGTFR